MELGDYYEYMMGHTFSSGTSQAPLDIQPTREEIAASLVKQLDKLIETASANGYYLNVQYNGECTIFGVFDIPKDKGSNNK
jgi:hypothetical protein